MMLGFQLRSWLDDYYLILLLLFDGQNADPISERQRGFERDFERNIFRWRESDVMVSLRCVGCWQRLVVAFLSHR